MALTKSLTLNNNVEMPMLGLGTWQTDAGEEVENAVQTALQMGYRHVDTAKIYRNEASVGKAIRNSNIPEDEIFVTTKLWDGDQGYDSALHAFDESQERLGINTIDLYLIHWPKPKNDRMDSWKALERLYDEGRVRAIGVSNYAPHHLEELLASANVPPAVNQTELHAYNFQSRLDTVEMCRKNGIVLTGYSPLAHAERMDDPKLNEIASKYERTPAQILLRWLLQQGVIVIPKSANEKRIRENSEIFDFEITEDDMAAMMKFDENFVTTSDPKQIP